MLRKTKADVAVLSTTSAIRDVKAQAALLIQKGLHVVTTCEEMSFPTPAHQAAFRDLDKLARKKKVSVLGHRRQPGLRDGRPRTDAHRTVRAGQPRLGHAGRGRGHAPAPSPAEGRAPAST